MTRGIAMNRVRGFSLIEMAVVLLIVVLLLGSVLVPFATQVEQRRIAETQKTLEEIKEALIGYAIAHGRLPCPATSPTNGSEYCPATSATVFAGLLPWSELGVAKLDSWGHTFRYAVSRNYTVAFSLPPPARAITVLTRDNTGALTPLTNNNDIVAVALSHGPNGYGGTNDDGTTISVPAQDQDEKTNVASASPNYVTRPAKKASAGCADAAGSPLCEFDDIVVWISPNVLFNRMVAAQRLP